jgi:hypothetical protein
MKNEAEQVAQNISITHTVLRSLEGAECNLNQAVCALLTAATVLIEEGYSAEHRLEALNQFLTPTIQTWAQKRGPVEMTLQ